MSGPGLGRRFGWFWAAYAASTLGPAAVSVLAAAGPAAGALAAVPLGPWVEARPKRPVMIAMDLARFAAAISIPVAYAFGRAELRAAAGGRGADSSR